MIDKLDAEQIQKLALGTLPLITGTALLLGITFDVGFFFALDPGFFSLFSLSEHALFALQALPLGLLITLMFITIMVPPLFMKAPRLPAILGIITGLFFIGISIYWRSYDSVALMLFAGLWFFYYSSLSRRDNAQLPRRIALLLSVLPPMLVFAFAYGMDLANRSKQPPFTHEVTVKGEVPTKGRLLRAGSFGVLYRNDKGRPVFRRWEDIVGFINLRDSF